MILVTFLYRGRRTTMRPDHVSLPVEISIPQVLLGRLQERDYGCEFSRPLACYLQIFAARAGSERQKEHSSESNVEMTHLGKLPHFLTVACWTTSERLAGLGNSVLGRGLERLEEIKLLSLARGRDMTGCYARDGSHEAWIAKTLNENVDELVE